MAVNKEYRVFHRTLTASVLHLDGSHTHTRKQRASSQGHRGALVTRPDPTRSPRAAPPRGAIGGGARRLTSSRRLTSCGRARAAAVEFVLFAAPGPKPQTLSESPSGLTTSSPHPPLSSSPPGLVRLHCMPLTVSPPAPTPPAPF